MAGKSQNHEHEVEGRRLASGLRSVLIVVATLGIAIGTAVGLVGGVALTQASANPNVEEIADPCGDGTIYWYGMPIKCGQGEPMAASTALVELTESRR